MLLVKAEVRRAIGREEHPAATRGACEKAAKGADVDAQSPSDQTWPTRSCPKV
jgi:hypothetical protein